MNMRSIATRALRQRCALHAASRGPQASARPVQMRSLSTTASVEASGPPFKKFFWITTGIMFGIPGALGAAFVYNLKTDDEFYEHFNEKYPDMIAWINEYVPLNEEFVALASREDIGDVTPMSELLNETVTVVAKLQSGATVRFQAQGSASQTEIEALAATHAGRSKDRVVSIGFVEDDDAEAAEASARGVEAGSASASSVAVLPPGIRTMWTGKKKPRADAVNEARDEIEAIRLQQLALEESKFAGRDIDEADEEIQALEARKIELKKLLPRKRFLWIF
ncbi:hypothetical protein Poli38472_001914 [Pythium oligandrum]|uniref:Uncharacterized protein n=1 Tax=Pythium oligandrum TaxID=41045 RepID=A0A8K1CWY3_PYTOL|nr:hypothetical protein Poli38472_001914 [Pythium oligandrum]|eukprot:TMW69758.1 hypothetical protein Poli38472_001914 [Pythium oligandrum]